MSTKRNNSNNLVPKGRIYLHALYQKLTHIERVNFAKFSTPNRHINVTYLCDYVYNIYMKCKLYIYKVIISHHLTVHDM